MISFLVDYQLSEDKSFFSPKLNEVSQWIKIALDNAFEAQASKDMPPGVKYLSDKCEYEISLYIVSSEKSKTLNHQWRGINSPTNILSFPTDLPLEVQPYPLGDLVVCPFIMEKEAKQQNKSYAEHWAHIIIHGVLHLLNYDHVIESEAIKMEGLEITCLTQLGIKNPYY